MKIVFTALMTYRLIQYVIEVSLKSCKHVTVLLFDLVLKGLEMFIHSGHKVPFMGGKWREKLMLYSQSKNWKIGFS